MKHSPAVKLAAVRFYLAGKAGINATAIRFRISHTHLCYWINLYRLHGRKALLPAPKRTYPPEFKLHVVLTVLQGADSLPRVAAQFNIPSHTTVKNWVRLYQEKGINAFRQQARNREKTMTHQPENKPATTQEELMKELRYLRAENAYLKAMQELLLEKKRREREKKHR